MTQFWAGFVDGKIDVRLVDSGHGGWGNSFTMQPALFVLKTDAEREYQDVRPIEIKEMS